MNVKQSSFLYCIISLVLEYKQNGTDFFLLILFFSSGQEKYVESIGEPPLTNDPQTATGQEERTHLDPVQIMTTTLSTTSTTDQSNLEDDDYHVVTKRDARPLPTPAPPPVQSQAAVETAPTRGSQSTATAPTSPPQYSEQHSVKGTSLPASTHAHGETTSSPSDAPTKSVDDILNDLLLAALVDTAQGNPTPPLAPPTDQLNSPTMASNLDISGSPVLETQFASGSQATKTNEYIAVHMDKSSVTISPHHESTASPNTIGVNGETWMNSADNTLPHSPNVSPADKTKDSVSNKEEDQLNPVPNDNEKTENPLVNNVQVPTRDDRMMPSHLHGDQVSLDMLTPKSRTVFQAEGSQFDSKGNQTSSDASHSLSDSNEFLSKEKKKSEDDVDPPTSISLSNQVDKTNSVTITTEAQDDSHEVTDSPPSTDSSTSPPESNNTERQSKEYTSREMVEFWGVENKTNSLHKHSDLELNAKSNQELSEDTLGVDSAEIFDTVSNLNDSSEVVSDENNATSSLDVAEQNTLFESREKSPEGSLDSNAVEASGRQSVEESSRDVTSSLLEQLDVESPALSEPTNVMEMEDCEEEHPSVCVTEALEELSLGKGRNLCCLL